MDKNDMDRLWTLLSTVWSRAPEKEDRQLKQAWQLALEPYAYGEVRKAAAEYIRKNKFFPDIYDITALINKSEPREDDSWYSLDRLREKLGKL